MLCADNCVNSAGIIRHLDGFGCFELTSQDLIEFMFYVIYLSIRWLEAYLLPHISSLSCTMAMAINSTLIIIISITTIFNNISN